MGKNLERRIRVLVAKPGFDSHWRGTLVFVKALMEAGMEVIYTGNQFPDEIVESVLQEDVDVLCLSILSGSHLRIIPKIAQMLREKGAKDTLIIVGGTIPKQDIPELKKAGVDEAFMPGTPLHEIVEYIKNEVEKRKGKR